MAKANSNGFELEFQTFGKRSDPSMLLVLGLGVQMIAWPDLACLELADSGFHVIRFDNRDCGLSTKFESAGLPNLFAGLAGDRSSAAYTLEDMARDSVGLLDYLNISEAHVVGVSMGGMIAQRAVIDFPDRFLSLSSIMSTTGSREVGQPSPEAVAALMQPLGQGRDAAILRSLEIDRVISSPRYFDEKRALDLICRSYDRCFYPQGAARQLMSVLIAGDRTDELKSVKVPTLVIHGLQDKLIDPSGGYATAEAISGSRLLTFGEMGHDIPPELWPEVRNAIIDNARRLP